MMNIQDHNVNRDTLPRNVIAFPSVRRSHAATHPSLRQSIQCGNHAIALAGAELNARLLILLGICMTSAALVLTTVNFLQG